MIFSSKIVPKLYIKNTSLLKNRIQGWPCLCSEFKFCKMLSNYLAPYKMAGLHGMILHGQHLFAKDNLQFWRDFQSATNKLYSSHWVHLSTLWTSDYFPYQNHPLSGLSEPSDVKKIAEYCKEGYISNGSKIPSQKSVRPSSVYSSLSTPLNISTTPWITELSP